MIAVGLALLAVYLGAAYGVFLLLSTLLADGFDPAATAGILLATTLAFGLLSYRFGARQVLSRVGAVELPRERAPALHRLIDDLCDRMGIDRPAVAIAHLGEPNAFALGGAGGGVIVFDPSLLRLLDRDELRAIAAHELAHLHSNDGLVQTLALSAVQTLVGVVVLVLFPLILLVSGLARASAWIGGRPASWTTTPFGRVYRLVGRAIALVLLGFTLVVRAHSRRREYAADDLAVEVTGNPFALARALRRIQCASESGWGLLSTLYVHGDDQGLLTRLLSTHPPLDDRVERLVERAEESRQARDGDRRRRIEVE
jgi:heat shock protein HtpX